MVFLILSLFYLGTAFAQQTLPPEVPPPGPTSIPRAIKRSDLKKETPPSATTSDSKAQGRFYTSEGKVKVIELLLHRYKDSVVRLTTRDAAGNKLSQAMGVSIGENAEGQKKGDSIYIATSLDLVLGSSLQWANTIEITHYSGAMYTGEVALIDEQLGVLLIKPKNQPAAVRFVSPHNERTLVDVMTISFDEGQGKIARANAHRAVLAALNVKEGTLALTGANIDNSQAGTAIINMQGQLMGMLLSNAKGVLSSTLLKLVLKANAEKTIHPRLVGVVMGRAVLVDAQLKSAYPTVASALKDIREGKAPKADPSRYLALPHRGKKNRVVLKVARGRYEIAKPIELPSNISFTGEGPGETVLVGASSSEPLIKIKDGNNVSISNFRLVPKEGQGERVATVSVGNSRNVSFLGNIIEAKGGRGLHVLRSKKISSLGNTFPLGTSKAIYCQISSMRIEANAFLGAWPQALAMGKDCEMYATKNLFLKNRVSAAISQQSSKVELYRNTFLYSSVGIRFFGGLPSLGIRDNLFFKNRLSIFTPTPIPPNTIGRNGAWKSFAFYGKERLQGLDFVIGKPEFRRPENYDFRLLPGSPLVNAGTADQDNSSTDMGAFQRNSFLGTYTSQLIHTLEAATGEKDLTKVWGYQ